MDHSKKIRYAVVGLGWISQKAMLPAFANAKENSELTALAPFKRDNRPGMEQVIKSPGPQNPN